MKTNKCKTIRSHFTSKIIPGLLVAFLIITSCSDQITTQKDNEATHTSFQTETLSVIDGNPVVKLQTENSEDVTYLEQFRDQLVSLNGSAIVAGLNAADEASKSQEGDFFETSSKLIHQLIDHSFSKSAEALSTHIILADPDGFEEEFVMAVRRYTPSAAKDSQVAAEVSRRSLTTENTWLALNVDRFYLEDDDNGNELWPVTFSAVSVADVKSKIEITFDKDGLVSTSLHKGSPDWESFNLAFIEPIPVMLKDEDSSMRARVNDWGRGEDTGSYGPNDTYFTLELVRLAWTGDGDGAAELQMFVKNDDNYNNNFPNKYKYRFDAVIRTDPRDGLPSNHRLIEGADKGNPYDIYYEVPDINHDGRDYSFQNIKMWFDDGGYDDMNVDRFPLFNFDDSPGPWRLVFSDDDKDYDKFSRRRQSDYADYVQTYDMSTGNWSNVYTGFTVERKTNGSSDDPILESGVRRITQSNADDRSDYLGKINASKSYDGGSRLFKYRFGMDQVVI